MALSRAAAFIRSGLSAELLLDSSHVVFKGREHETKHDVERIKGTVVFNTELAVKTKGVTLEFYGQQQTHHFVKPEDIQAGFNAPSPIVTKLPCHFECIPVRDNKGTNLEKIPAGKSAYRFSVNVPGDLPESIELVRGQFRLYELTLNVAMGPFARDVKVNRKIRIIRTLKINEEDDLLPETIGNHWIDKLRYEIGIAQRAVVYGDKVKVDIELTPIMEKLRVGEITIYIRERVKTRTDPGADRCPALGSDYWHFEHSNIATQTFEIPEDCDELEDPGLGLPMKRFSLFYSLPTSLKDCRQSVERGHWIQTKHHLHVDMVIHNPEGHSSEVRASLPIKLFLHPSLQIDENENVRPIGFTSAAACGRSLTAQATGNAPGYGEHIVDEIIPASTAYNPVTGMASIPGTPGVESGAATPGIALMSGEAFLPNPQALHAALQHVVGSQSTPQHADLQNVAGSQQTSGWDYSALSRVTSYRTAKRATESTSITLPPSYEIASRPPSRPHTPPNSQPPNQ